MCTNRFDLFAFEYFLLYIEGSLHIMVCLSTLILLAFGVAHKAKDQNIELGVDLKVHLNNFLIFINLTVFSLENQSISFSFNLQSSIRFNFYHYP